MILAQSILGIVIFITQLLKISLSKELMQTITLITICAGLVIILVTVGFAVFRRIYKRIQTQFEAHFRKWVAEEFTLLAKSPKHIVTIPLELKAALKNSIKRNIAVEELLVCKKYLKGVAMQAAVNLYEELDLRKVTNKKLKSGIWSRVVTGIQEIYIFDQYDAMEQLYRFADNSNPFIRAEAQFGVVNLQGFDALRFLKNVQNQLSTWDQINILEQLKLFTPKPLDEMPIWISSTNDSVVLLGLKILFEYPDGRFYTNMIACLDHSNPLIRYHAIRCCEKINVFDTNEKLENQYSNETIENQLLLLDVLMLLPEIPGAKLLVSLLKEPNELIRLKAAENIAKHYDKGLLLVESVEDNNKERKAQLIKHLQTEICL
ncbi:MAG: hypothetical protein EAZ12_06270 [Sphingobacteriia bacterium]|nr:MAG: hypothetical protein EAZ12_06270 [Sphingobacteriia bacterium]